MFIFRHKIKKRSNVVFKIICTYFSRGFKSPFRLSLNKFEYYKATPKFTSRQCSVSAKPAGKPSPMLGQDWRHGGDTAP